MGRAIPGAETIFCPVIVVGAGGANQIGMSGIE
jgi:hypothetical protein